jgi:hypothetical protein
MQQQITTRCCLVVDAASAQLQLLQSTGRRLSKEKGLQRQV